MPPRSCARCAWPWPRRTSRTSFKPQMPGGHASPEYLKISPLGKIPCFQDGDYTLPDSSCIIAYLERTQPKPALYPEDPKEYGRALFFEEYADSKLVETLGPVFFQRVVRKLFFKQEARRDDRAQEDRPGGAAGLRLARGPDRRPRVAGRHALRHRRLAMASPFVNFAHAGETVDAKRWPRLAAYLERVHARPSFKALIEEERQTFKPAGLKPRAATHPRRPRKHPSGGGAYTAPFEGGRMRRVIGADRAGPGRAARDRRRSTPINRSPRSRPSA